MKRFFLVIYDALARFNEDDGWAIASHVTLQTLTAMFPFLIVVTALAGFLGSKQLADEATGLLLETWPAQVADPLSAEIHNVLTQARSGLLTVGAVLSIYFASSGVEALRVALNRAYGQKESRSWWLLRLESIAFVLVGAMALVALSFLVVLAPLVWNTALRHLPQLHVFQTLFDLLRFGIATVSLVAALVIAHKWLPSGRRSFRSLWPGITATFVMSGGAAVAFSAYLARFSENYVTTYAGLASVMIALVFLYALSSIFILGGELNAALARAKEARTRQRAEAGIQGPNARREEPAGPQAPPLEP